MKLYYKCAVELELDFPDGDDINTQRAKAAIDELIDSSICNAVQEECCGEKDKITVTREYLRYEQERYDTANEVTDPNVQHNDNEINSV